MKQINPKLYNQEYFKHQSASPDFNKKIKITDFQVKYKKIASLTKIKPNQIICDYGCGTGDLTFFLSLKYNCKIIAIDYSSDAIKICKNKLKLFKKNTNSKAQIKFLNKNNKQIPDLKNIKTVFFSDVFEHLYDSEINLILFKILKWNKTTDIAIHTDNNRYLNFIKPIIQTIGLISKTTTVNKIKKENLFNQKRHINLTNPNKLKKKMKSLGFNQIKIIYPYPSVFAVKSQLGKLSNSKRIVNLSLKIIRKIPTLSPSFFALYRFNFNSKSDACL